MWIFRYLIIKFLIENVEEYICIFMVGRNYKIKLKSSVQLNIFYFLLLYRTLLAENCSWLVFPIPIPANSLFTCRGVPMACIEGKVTFKKPLVNPSYIVVLQEPVIKSF